METIMDASLISDYVSGRLDVQDAARIEAAMANSKEVARAIRMAKLVRAKVELGLMQGTGRASGSKS